MFSIRQFRQYFKSHPHYIPLFIRDLMKVYWGRLCRRPIVVMTTESGGLGDYLWLQSFIPVIRSHYFPKRCTIVVLGMYGLGEFIRTVNTNQVDVFRGFESCDSHKKIESLFFRLFTADVFLDVRALCLCDVVKTRKKAFGKGVKQLRCFYREASNIAISQWIELPKDFRHSIPILPIRDRERLRQLEKPYIFLVEGGFTQGKLCQRQLIPIVQHIIKKGYRVFYNGDRNTLVSHLPEELHPFVIDGYQYPLCEYAYVVRQSALVVTINTAMYHYALMLERPVVAISVNEYLTLDLAYQPQELVFNEELQASYADGNLEGYHPIPGLNLEVIDTDRVISSIDKLVNDL